MERLRITRQQVIDDGDFRIPEVRDCVGLGFELPNIIERSLEFGLVVARIL